MYVHQSDDSPSEPAPCFGPSGAASSHGQGTTGGYVYTSISEIPGVLPISRDESMRLKGGTAKVGPRVDMHSGIVINLTCIMRTQDNVNMQRNRFLSDNELEYHRSTSVDHHNIMMARVGDREHLFTVNIGEGCRNYLWGFCTIRSYSPHTERFVIERVAPSEVESEDAEGMPIYQPMQVNVPGECNKGNVSTAGPVDPVDPVDGTGYATHEVDIHTTHQGTGSNTEAAKAKSCFHKNGNVAKRSPRSMGPYTIQSKKTVHQGHLYDSVLEARVAVFLSALGVTYNPHCVTFKIKIPMHMRPLTEQVADKSEWDTQYTPDFMAPGMAIEVKPTSPMDEEIQKCQSVACHCMLTIACLFGDPGVLPFSGSNKRTRDHHKGFRGYIWMPGSSVFSNVVWMWDDAKQIPFLGCRMNVDDKRWDHPRIRYASECARRAVFT